MSKQKDCASSHSKGSRRHLALGGFTAPYLQQALKTWLIVGFKGNLEEWELGKEDREQTHAQHNFQAGLRGYSRADTFARVHTGVSSHPAGWVARPKSPAWLPVSVRSLLGQAALPGKGSHSPGPRVAEGTFVLASCLICVLVGLFLIERRRTWR